MLANSGADRAGWTACRICTTETGGNNSEQRKFLNERSCRRTGRFIAAAMLMVAATATTVGEAQAKTTATCNLTAPYRVVIGQPFREYKLYGSAKGAFQYKERGTTAWKGLKAVTTNSAGSATMSYRYGKTRDYRFVLYTTPVSWDQASATTTR